MTMLGSQPETPDMPVAADLGEAPEGHETPTVDAEEIARAVEEGRIEGGEVPAVYDSTARQRIPVTLLLDDGRYNVALVCEPTSDAVMLQYARLCEKAAAAESAEDEEVGAAQVGALSAAVIWLFDTLMSDIEGVGEEGEEKPEDWRGIFSAQERQAVVDRAVFGVEPVEPPAPKKGKRPAWGSHLRAVVNRVRVPFDGRTVETVHTLRKADAKQLGEFTALYARTFGATRATDAHLAKFAAGYDRLHVAHENYKGPVPMHHKAAVYVMHMTRQGAAVRKN